jgi:hypothetical protein
MPLAVISFLVGALIAGVGVFYYTAQDSVDSAMLFALGDGAKAHTRAMQAYQHEEPSVAIWELRHLADLQAEHLKHGMDSERNLQLQLFLTHGRLASLYQREGAPEHAHEHGEKAIAYYAQYSPTNQFATNMTSLLDLIQQFDARAKVESKHE